MSAATDRQTSLVFLSSGGARKHAQVSLSRGLACLVRVHAFVRILLESPNLGRTAECSKVRPTPGRRGVCADRTYANADMK